MGKFKDALLMAAGAMILFFAVILATKPAEAAQQQQDPTPGATCQNSTTRYSAKADRLALDTVRVLELAPLPSGAAGAWVMPVSGSMAWAQFFVSVDSLTECKP